MDRRFSLSQGYSLAAKMVVEIAPACFPLTSRSTSEVSFATTPDILLRATNASPGQPLRRWLRYREPGRSVGGGEPRLVDLSPERAEVVRRLNAAGVPVIAWQLLPEEQGYWYNMSNAPSAAARYSAFRAWTAEHG